MGLKTIYIWVFTLTTQYTLQVSRNTVQIQVNDGQKVSLTYVNVKMGIT